MTTCSRLFRTFGGLIRRFSAVHFISLCGLILIAVGVFLPWVGETPLRIYVPGMRSGFERPWPKRLFFGSALGFVLLLLNVFGRIKWAITGPVLATTGATVLIVLVSASPLTSRWTTDVGVYVTLIGGLLLVASPAIPVLRTRFLDPPVWCRSRS